MENYIEGRVILGMLCFMHVFMLYASQCPLGPIKRRTLESVIFTEFIAVTAFIIYDNLQTPPYDGWFLAILGYTFVYGLIFLTWVAYGVFARLDENKVYEMTITHHIHFMNKDYLQGTVFDGKYEQTVLLPYSQELYPLTEDNIKQKVMFDNVLRGNILVKRVNNH
jgi:hypothetical protein